MKLKRIGVDLAKQVFQIHGVDSHEQAVCRKQLKRSQMLDFFRQLEPCTVAMEACGSSHYWARELRVLGHEVRLIAPQFVKPYVKSGKNDANDAEAICEAASRPNMRYVEVKSAEQQAGQALHRIRSRLIRARTALVNEIRGLLGEFGLVESRHGVAATRRLAQAALADAENGLPGQMRGLLVELQGELVEHEARLSRLDETIQRRAREDERVERLMLVEGIGPITATALVSAVGDARQFRSARQFAALAGVGSSPTLQRRQGAAGPDQQARRYLLAHAAGSRSPSGAQALPGQGGSTQPVAPALAVSTQPEHRHGRFGEQECPDRLGDPQSGRLLSTWLKIKSQAAQPAKC
uniref:IS110 family transposase n=1 Tax=Azotobacter sp. NL3 TaxID=3083257 RepID=UPI00406D3566